MSTIVIDKPDHPLVGVECAVCHELFAPGDGVEQVGGVTYVHGRHRNEMPVAYVVWGSKGEYSDTTIWIAGIFATKGEAESLVERCESWLAVAVAEAREREFTGEDDLSAATVAACPDPVFRNWIDAERGGLGMFGSYDRETEWSVATGPELLG